MNLYVGTSGFSYKEWKGNFYPEKLPAKEMLPYYASRLPSVEINNTFYRLPRGSLLSFAIRPGLTMMFWIFCEPTIVRFAFRTPTISRSLTSIIQQTGVTCVCGASIIVKEIWLN